MNSADANKPIIVKKIKRGGAGAHGGAWKVAFADFMTSMMALFLVLYLIEATTTAEKQAISMYFTNPTAYTEGGSPFVVNFEGGMRNTDAVDRVSSPAPPTSEPDVSPDKNTQPNLSQELIEKITKEEQQKQLQELHEQKENLKFEELKQMLENRIEADPTLGALKDQIIIKITDEGLMIEVVDKDKRPMFDSGRDVIKPYMRTILREVSKTLLDVPNPLSISGHTDAVPFTEMENYSNWELSSDRANAARRAMLLAGIKEKQIIRVVGLADSHLYDKKNPDNPINRRISILAMRIPPEPLKPAPEGEQKPDAATQQDVASSGVTSPAAAKTGNNSPQTGQSAVPASTASAVDQNLPPDEDFPTGFVAGPGAAAAAATTALQAGQPAPSPSAAPASRVFALPLPDVTPGTAVPPTVTVPRPSAPDEEFF